MDKKPLLSKAEMLSEIPTKKFINHIVESSKLSKEEAEELLWEATKISFSATFDFVE